MASDQRLSSLPDAQTVSEAGIRDFRADNLFGLVAPKGTPPQVIKQLSSAMKEVLASPELGAAMEAQGVQIRYTAPEPFGRMIGDEMRAWEKVARAANVKIE